MVTAMNNPLCNNISLRLRCRRGLAAVEFALIVPLLLLLYCGIIELTQLLIVSRKVLAVSQTTADLITQEVTITNSQLADIVKAANLILEPFPTASLTKNFASVRFNAVSGAPELVWQELFGVSPGGSSVLPGTVGLGLAGEGVVVTTITYTYTPVFTSIVTGPLTLTEMAYSRPRKSKIVTRTIP
jgi:Flp pilus assembly protein TadG